ncbi:hypothetical protein [Parapedobacter lycopersici]|uniref:hypothetical protein n=1 Tax=Parapedobacter lycopersici TaxID=1864939 RepID=UPI00214D65F8|nr:hypothetical protein [Parapedobacter lycopersici]
MSENKDAVPDHTAETDTEPPELVFVITDAHDGGKVAVEGRYGIVFLMEEMDDLQGMVVGKVQEHFGGTFHGKIRIRQYVDELISMKK